MEENDGSNISHICYLADIPKNFNFSTKNSGTGKGILPKKKNPKVFKNPAFLLFSIIHDLNKKFLSTDLILVSNFFRFKDHCVR